MEHRQTHMRGVGVEDSRGESPLTSRAASPKLKTDFSEPPECPESRNYGGIDQSVFKAQLQMVTKHRDNCRQKALARLAPPSSRSRCCSGSSTGRLPFLASSIRVLTRCSHHHTASRTTLKPAARFSCSLALQRAPSSAAADPASSYLPLFLLSAPLRTLTCGSQFFLAHFRQILLINISKLNQASKSGIEMGVNS